MLSSGGEGTLGDKQEYESTRGNVNMQAVSYVK